MNCQQATRHIWDYCDNKLSPELGAAVESHCRECPQCNNHLQLTVLENEALKNTSELPQLSSGFTARVMKNLPEQDFAPGKKTSRRLRSLSGRKRWMAASTAVLGVLLVLLVLPGINNLGIIKFTQQSVTPPAPSQPEEQQNIGSLGTAVIVKHGIMSMEAVPSEEKKELTSADNSSPATEPAPPPSPPPAAYSADSSSVSRGTTVNETTGNPNPDSPELESPYSISLPGTYTLVNISSNTDDNCLIYKFAQDKTDIVVDVIVSRVESYKAEGGKLAAPSPSAAPETNAATAKASRDQTANSEISWTVTSGDASYRLTLNGNLSPQELALLAGSVSFKVK